MNELNQLAASAKTILIAGHLRPDGDCCGACIASYHYLHALYPEKQISVYLEKLPEVFEFMDKEHVIISTKLPKEPVDLFLSLDCSTPDRLGAAEPFFHKAVHTACIDHHISNKGYGGQNFIHAGASSTCEVLYDMMDPARIDHAIAEALYIGIIFDSGVFRYSNTSRHTLEIAGALVEKGIPFWKYIDECFYQRSYIQTQLLGRTLLTSMRLMEGKCIVATITRRMMEFYGAKTEDIEGIIDQLRVTKGVEVAILLHEIGEQQYKVSMRSNQYIDVSRIAVYFGGGGHVKAAGCTMRGSIHDVINNITELIDLQMQSETE